jgi:AcrR family transcriptional regulator
VSDDLRERVLAAAGRCVADRGIAGTSVERVARQAGVSRATLYRHFPQGRTELFNELIAFEVERFFVGLRDAVAGLRTIDEVLEVGLRHAHRAVEHHFLLHAVLREDPGILEPSLSNTLHQVEHAVGAFVGALLPADRHLDERADVLARSILDYIGTEGRWRFDEPGQVRQLVRDELLAWRDADARRPHAARVRPLRPVEDANVRGRVVGVALDEVAHGRYATFTVESVARRASISRATLYRSFPGGRDSILEAAATSEGAHIFAAVADAMSGEGDLHGCLLAGLTTLWHHVGQHEALNGLLLSEPELIRRQLRFDAGARTYFVASSFAQPLLGRWVDSATAGRIAEWLCRIAVSYWLQPAPYLDITKPVSVATFYGRHLAAGVDRLAGATVPR